MVSLFEERDGSNLYRIFPDFQHPVYEWGSYYEIELIYSLDTAVQKKVAAEENQSYLLPNSDKSIPQDCDVGPLKGTEDCINLTNYYISLNEDVDEVIRSGDYYFLVPRDLNGGLPWINVFVVTKYHNDYVRKVLIPSIEI